MKAQNKLIRSKILLILQAKGVSFKSHFANEEEYEKKLLEKLLEEAAEINKATSLTERTEELADLLEVVDAIKAWYGISTEEIETIRLQKLEEKGHFMTPIILDES